MCSGQHYLAFSLRIFCIRKHCPRARTYRQRASEVGKPRSWRGIPQTRGNYSTLIGGRILSHAHTNIKTLSEINVIFGLEGHQISFKITANWTFWNIKMHHLNEDAWRMKVWEILWNKFKIYISPVKSTQNTCKLTGKDHFWTFIFFSVTFASNRISKAEHMISAHFPSSKTPAL